MEWCTGNEITIVAIDGGREREINPILVSGEHPYPSACRVFQQHEFGLSGLRIDNLSFTMFQPRVFRTDCCPQDSDDE
jgi:hypothetical protein